MARLVVCLDIKDGRTTKGVKFQGNCDVGDPVCMAESYSQSGADEIIIYDISASIRGSSIDCSLLKAISSVVDVPLGVGGGLTSLDEVKLVFDCGVSKVSLNTPAVRNPGLIKEISDIYGRSALILGVDALVDSSCPSGYRVMVSGGRVNTAKDLLEWIKEAEDLGAGEIVLNSIDADGTKQGYDCNLITIASKAVSIPVIASGGAGRPDHLCKAIQAGADGVLVASILHYGDYSINDLKDYLTLNCKTH